MTLSRMSRAAMLAAAVLLAASLFSGCNKSGDEGMPAGWTEVDGMRIHDVAVGQGAEAVDGDYVSVHYTGWLYVNDQKTDKFDSSVDRGEPFVFQVGAHNVIQGWDVGIPGMRVGGERELIIPPEMGYGERQAGSIPPNSTLFFDVQLLDILSVKVDTLATGDGPVAEDGDIVTVHYTGWISENGEKGAKFDSSRDRGQPFQFTLGAGRVIRGWDMGVKGMHVGDTVLLTIPPELAYGKRGVKRGDEVIIPPDATLIFEVELLGVQGKQ